MLQHKFIAAVCIIVLLGVGYYGYKKVTGTSAETRYVLAAVEKGTLIVSVSGSGQVSASNQIDLKSKAGGQITYLGIKSGQAVKAGQTLVQIDARDANKTVRDAKMSLETAQLNYEKLKKPADKLTLLQAQNAVIQAKDSLTKLKSANDNTYKSTLESKQKEEEALKKAYEDGFNSVSNAFLSLPGVITGLNSLLTDKTLSSDKANLDWYADNADSSLGKTMTYRDDVSAAYLKARQAYDTSFASYKLATRTLDNAAIEKLIDDTYDTVKVVSDAIKTTDNFVDYTQDSMVQNKHTVPNLVNTHQSTLSTYTGTINTHLSALLSIKTTIDNSKMALVQYDRDIKDLDQNDPLEIASAEQSIKEKEASLADLKAGMDNLDERLQKLTLEQKENSLQDAKDKLADYTVSSPFSGIVAVVGVKDGETISSGATVATLVSHKYIAEISLNEVDIVKVAVGQKATLTFDAIEGLSASGEVMEMDILGTVSQGVVNYSVKIGFDTQDERIKPGMSVSAAVITDAKQDVIMIDNSAIKSSGDVNYVEMISGTVTPAMLADKTGVTSATIPLQQQIEVGLANDTSAEILSGLKEGDAIIVRTVTAAAATTQAKSLFNLGGGGGGGIPRR
ncbi:MAG: efflux RND transporter periplasmic adaptor subunit [Candidatus Gracilibacteria bacterium]